MSVIDDIMKMGRPLFARKLPDGNFQVGFKNNRKQIMDEKIFSDMLKHWRIVLKG